MHQNFDRILGVENFRPGYGIFWSGSGDRVHQNFWKILGVDFWWPGSKFLNLSLGVHFRWPGSKIVKSRYLTECTKILMKSWGWDLQPLKSAIFFGNYITAFLIGWKLKILILTNQNRCYKKKLTNQISAFFQMTECTIIHTMFGLQS